MADESPVSRRTFLAASGAAAGSLALPAASFGQIKGANDRLSLGIIGCGGMATQHLTALLKMRDSENLRFAAVTDVFRKQAERFRGIIEKEGGGKVKIADSYQDILAMSDVDYVLIATPEHSHAYLTLDALDAGKHVYVEKPLTHTIEESQAVVKKAAETGLQLQVGVQSMADDSYASANAAIRAGKIGTVIQAQIDYVRKYPKDKGPWRKGVAPDKPQPKDLDWAAWLRPAPDRPWDPRRYEEWRCYQDYSGGIATDLFIHRLTRILKACGLAFPERVTGMGGIYLWPDGRDLPDNFEMLAEYPAVDGITNGMTVHVLGTMANDLGVPHCIRGDGGTLTFTDRGWEITPIGSKEVIASHKKTGGEDVAPHHRNHHQAIREGAALNCPPELGLYGVAAVCMANLSWKHRQSVLWDPTAARAILR